MLEIRDLHVSVDSKPILKGVSLRIKQGEVHAILGKNGSGKSSLAYTLMGHPRYHVESGDLLWEGQSILSWSTTDRARAGMFLSFQSPPAIPGVITGNLLRASLRAVRSLGEAKLSGKEIRSQIRREAEGLGVAETFLGRGINDGFSGGERKRLETLQFRLLAPKLAIFDETDSGLDRDAVKLVCERIRERRAPDKAFLVITHYHRMLEALEPTSVHVLEDGRISRSGGMELAHSIEAVGFSQNETHANLQ